MLSQEDAVMLFRPSLRRAYFYSFLYIALITACRLKLDIPASHPAVLSAVGILVVVLACAHLARACIQYTLTPELVRVDTGIIARKHDRIPLERITDATARQSVLERCLGIVNIYINTAGSPRSEACFRRILKGDAEEFSVRFRELRKQKKTETREAA